MNRRSGFSLIEILVVMTIMAIVVGLSLAAMGPTLAAARVGQTKTLMAKLGSLIDERVRTLEKTPQYSDGNGMGGISEHTFWDRYNNPYTGNPRTISQQLGKAIAQRHNYRLALPQRLEDAFGYDGQYGTRDDGPILKAWLSKTGGVLRPTGHQLKNESAKLLYLALMQGADSKIRDSIEPKFIAYLDPNDKAMDLPSFVDGWGNPIRFYNWPTRLIRPNGPTSNIDRTYFTNTAKVLVPSLNCPATPSPFPPNDYSSPLNQDPNDPRREFVRMLSTTTLTSAPYRLAVWGPGPGGLPEPVANDTCPPLDVNSLYELATWNAPLVISAGEDGEFGLELTTAAGADRLCKPLPNAEDVIGDNITNKQTH